MLAYHRIQVPFSGGESAQHLTQAVPLNVLSKDVVSKHVAIAIPPGHSRLPGGEAEFMFEGPAERRGIHESPMFSDLAD
jgi:hypothetical protein